MPSEPLTVPSGGSQGSLAERFQETRGLTMALVAPLSAEDCVAQSMPDASPAKWHLAHTSWFFEQFVLQPNLPSYRSFGSDFSYLFNSYYESVGPRQPRPQRGLLTRPSLAEVQNYRRHVDETLLGFLARGTSPEIAAVVELGLQHEQQHQELLLMDVKHLLFCNPLKPAYRIYKESARRASRQVPPDPRPMHFRGWPGGIYEIGHAGTGFCFDNETPRHRVYLEPFAISHRPVSNGEYLLFILEGGYKKPELWLADGWGAVQANGWTAPLYWGESLYEEFTLGGMRPLDLHAPVCHVSYYEADAFARWTGARLPTEAEWEVAASAQEIRGNFLDSVRLHPMAAPGGAAAAAAAASEDELPMTAVSAATTVPSEKVRLMQLFGDMWEWTSSAYTPYPGFKPLDGELGEYNGKFMANQWVMRGGSCVTPRNHIRASYRNFFYPHMRWQFGGIRLAKESRP